MIKMMQTINNKTAGVVIHKVLALTIAMMAMIGMNLATTTAQNYAPQNRYAAQNNYMVPVSSRVGGFYVLMPGEAKYTSKPVRLNDGSSVTAHHFTYETADGKFAYTVAYNDFARDAIRGNMGSFFNRVAKGGAEGVKGRVVKVTATTQNGYPARLVKIETDKYIAFNKAILAGKRLYQVVFIMPKNASIPDAAVKFFNSLRIG